MSETPQQDGFDRMREFVGKTVWEGGLFIVYAAPEVVALAEEAANAVQTLNILADHLEAVDRPGEARGARGAATALGKKRSDLEFQLAKGAK